MPFRLLCLPTTLLGLFAPPLYAADDAAPLSRLQVIAAKDLVTVTHTGEPPWAMVLDREHGGVVRDFRLPADGPNLVAVSAKADGGVNSFRGMFSLFYMSRVGNDPDDDRLVKAKGTLWGRSNGSAALRVVSRGADEVVIETKGRGFGWRLLGPATEPIIEYTQTYTFRPGRVRVAGAFTWVYPYNTELVQTCVLTFFAPDAVNYPVRAVYEGGTEVALPLTSSRGSPFPGEGYPRSLLVDLTTGYRLDLRPRRLPGVVEKSRWSFFERPWQQDWAQAIGFMGTTAAAKEKFPAGKPVEYEYEVGLSRPRADDLPPRLTITAPKREAKYKPGDAVRFAAAGTDGRGRTLPGSGIAWEVFHNISELKAAYTGAAFTYTLPDRAEAYGKHDYVVAVATVTDTAGRKSRSYVTINVDRGESKK
jgi:hypothetical protein